MYPKLDLIYLYKTLSSYQITLLKMQAINGCAFCRSNRKSWTDHTVEVCVVLANVECGYCHQKGHTPKKCPKSALKKEREAEWAQRQQDKCEEKLHSIPEPKGKSETQKKSSWASLVVNSLSEAERERMEQQHRDQLDKEAEERRNEASRKKLEWEERKRQWEIRNKRRIVRQYGLDKDNGICSEGSFWFFFTEGTKDDIPEAKMHREDSNNQYQFKKYLQEKYWVNWLSRSEFTEDNCPILDRWRWEEEKAEYEREQRENEEVERYCKQQEDIDNAMKTKVESGEITQKQYDDWKRHKEIEEDYAWQAEGEIAWRQIQLHDQQYQAWKQRSQNRT